MKKKKIKRVDIFFENCDVAVVKGRHLENVIVDKEKFVLEINKKGNRFYYPFGIHARVRLFDRIVENDITSIEIRYSDGPAIRCFLPWKDTNGTMLISTNLLQNNELLKNGSLRITTDFGVEDVEEFEDV